MPPKPSNSRVVFSKSADQALSSNFLSNLMDKLSGGSVLCCESKPDKDFIQGNQRFLAKKEEVVAIKIQNKALDLGIIYEDDDNAYISEI